MLGSSDALGESMYYATCESANVDGRSGDELICFQNNYQAAAGTGGHRVVVLTYDAAATPAFKTLWNAAPVPKATGALTQFGTSVSDLDGDGKLEITVVLVDRWRGLDDQGLRRQDRRRARHTLAEKLVGVLDVDGDKKPEVVTETSAGVVHSQVRAWSSCPPSIRSPTSVTSRCPTAPTGRNPRAAPWAASP